MIRSLKSTSTESIPKTLIFTLTKESAWKVFHVLQRAAVKNYYVGMYHADQTQQTKLFIQQTFSSPHSNTRCLVATIAFGMVCNSVFCVYTILCVNIQGVDIGDIEVVVVYGTPKTASQLYQVVINQQLTCMSSELT